MPQPTQDALNLEQDAKIELFTIDTTSVGGTAIYRFCNDKQTGGQDVSFAGKTFVAFPIAASGFERSAKGQRAQPTLTASNVGGILSTILLNNNDLIGARVTRQRTYAKYLDGQPLANPTLEFTPDVFIVARKPSENEIQVQLALKDVASFGSLKLPLRKIQKFTCPWRYRSAECGYMGAPVATKNDIPTSDPTLDDCSRNYRGCAFRFPNEKPFGGFPGVDV